MRPWNCHLEKCKMVVMTSSSSKFLNPLKTKLIDIFKTIRKKVQSKLTHMFRLYRSTHTYTHSHTHTCKSDKMGWSPRFLTLGPKFFNLAFLIIYDRQFLTEWRSYQQRNKFCVEICTVRKMLTDVQKFTKENFEVYKIWKNVKNGIIGDFVFFGISRNRRTIL